MDEKSVPAYQDIENLKRWLFIFFGLSALANIIYLVSILSDSQEALIVTAFLYLAIYITTGVFFLRWVYVSNRNARALGANDMRHSPGWSVGWYFIPIVTLWKPYQAMKEIYMASHPDFKENWKEAAAPGFLPLWWALWIISGILSQISFRMTLNNVDSTGVDMIAGVFDFALIAMGFVMVNKLYEWQSRKRTAFRVSIQA